MPNDPLNPLIIQGDRSILLDVHTPRAAEARSALIPFAELEKSPEHLHTYRITPLSLWNAASAGFTPEGIAETLDDLARFPVPQGVKKWVIETMARFGKIRMIPGSTDSLSFSQDDYLFLVTDSPMIYRELAASKVMSKYLVSESDREFTFRLAILNRGTVKQELLKLGWPVKDEAPLKDGDPLEINLLPACRSGAPLVIRDYQTKAAAALVGDRGPGTGFGTIVLPCGAGKTIVGMTVMSMLKTNTLILTTNVAAVHQWINELLDKTSLDENDIGEYTGDCKVV